jgi:hypothetical protein
MRTVQHDCQGYATNKSAFARVPSVSNYHQTKSPRVAKPREPIEPGNFMKEAPASTLFLRPRAALPVPPDS